MRLPIFPLNLVLFPGQIIPLHIYEERYKEMLQHCLRQRIPFGVVLTRDPGRGGRGTPHAVGTLAQVTQTNEVPEGMCNVQSQHRGNCYHIVCRGAERFRVTSLDRREAAYLVAEIDLLPDEPAPAPAMLMVGQRVADLFDTYYRGIVALMGGWQKEATPGERTLMFDLASLLADQAQPAETGPAGERKPREVIVPTLPEDPTALANMVAAELNMQPQVKQDLLEAPSALARLQREAEVLAEETPLIAERLKLQHRRRFGAFGMSN